MQMLAKDPADRPASAGDVGRAATGAAAHAWPRRPPRRSTRPEATRTLPAVAAACRPGRTPTETAVVDAAARHRHRPRLPAARRLAGRRDWLPYAIALAVAALVVLLAVRACGSDPDVHGWYAGGLRHRRGTHGADHRGRRRA